ncbi:Histidine ammonia-lyase [Labilithrix luteola]|uniref:Histidine ammonia-lyase n=1 Tax=Labilithrix luteola TaxID=1391654 RepID=A0A0K1QBW6_9BACT|nr:histidine ammonia-lyase [Labilithrix luteola]AKV03213.1 Histidine ammonia-lyase [Labilithrix luteola]
MPVQIGRPISLSDLEDVAVRGRPVAFAEEARAKVVRSRAAIDAIANAGDGAPRVYGVNTGFGALSETRIGAADVRALQQNLVRSHTTGVGPNLSPAEVRGMMLLRAQVLALGHSGVRPELVDVLVAMLNAKVHPRIPSQGSVGASGDLAPLAHLALTMIGEGEAQLGDGPIRPSADVLREAGVTPVTLEAKEGLALINGTQYMASLGTLALLEAERLCVAADLAGAMSLEALKGSSRPFDERLHIARPHPGQATVANNLRVLLADSAIAESHRDCGKVQDAYSLRCMPQVHGASRDALGWVRSVLEREVNSITDNPSVFVDRGETEIISGGNFHGQPLALALDLAAMAAAELANISERRVEQLVNPALSTGLTPFLAAGSGLHSGFMIAQVTSASLVSENKVLCHPASVDSIPSSAGKEDHVSMGSVSAKKLRDVVKNVRACLAIEIMTAAAGLDQRAPLTPSKGVAAALKKVREKVAPMVGDRPLYGDIESVSGLVASHELVRTVESSVGALA